MSPKYSDWITTSKKGGILRLWRKRKWTFKTFDVPEITVVEIPIIPVKPPKVTPSIGEGGIDLPEPVVENKPPVQHTGNSDPTYEEVITESGQPVKGVKKGISARVFTFYTDERMLPVVTKAVGCGVNESIVVTGTEIKTNDRLQELERYRVWSQEDKNQFLELHRTNPDAVVVISVKVGDAGDGYEFFPGRLMGKDADLRSSGWVELENDQFEFADLKEADLNLPREPTAPIMVMNYNDLNYIGDEVKVYLSTSDSSSVVEIHPSELKSDSKSKSEKIKEWNQKQADWEAYYSGSVGYGSTTMFGGEYQGPSIGSV